MSKDFHYAILNARFDERAAELIKLGYRYTHVLAWNLAVFAKARIGKVVPATISASLVMNADDIVWQDTLSREYQS